MTLESNMPSDSSSAAPIVVFDIDGVLADASHRQHHLRKSPKDWKSFFKDAALDPIINEGLTLLQRARENAKVVLITGRPQNLESATFEWMRQSGIPDIPVMFRSVIDHRPGKLVKADHLVSLGGPRKVSVIYEDDEDTAAYLSRVGYNVVRFV